MSTAEVVSSASSNSKSENVSPRDSIFGPSRSSNSNSSNAISRSSKIELSTPRSSGAPNYRASSVSSLSFGDAPKNTVVSGTDPRRWLETEEVKSNIAESKRPSSVNSRMKKVILGNNQNLLMFFLFSFFVR